MVVANSIAHQASVCNFALDIFNGTDSQGGEMKRGFLLVAVLSVFVALGMGSNLWAMPLQIQVGDKIVLSDGDGPYAYIPGEGRGGAYTASSPDGSWDNFLTFCLEADESLAFGKPFLIGGITTEAQRGGVNTDAGDPLDPFTAWLYTGVVNGAYSSDLLDDVQYAIWYTEEEIASISGSAKDFYDAQREAFLSSGWTGLGNVRVLNLFDAYGNFRQDVLASVNTPEPSAAILLGIGLLAVATFNQKRLIKSKK